MLILRDPSHVQSVQNPAIRELVAQRFSQLGQQEPYDPDSQGYFIVVATGDTVTALEAAADWPILGGIFDDSRYGDPDFSPAFEVLEEHVACYEVAYVLSDSGACLIVIVPKEAGIDADLLHFCQAYATPEPGLALTK